MLGEPTHFIQPKVSSFVYLNLTVNVKLFKALHPVLLSVKSVLDDHLITVTWLGRIQVVETKAEIH